MSTTDTTKAKSRTRRATVPAPQKSATSTAIDELTGGDAPRIVMVPVDRIRRHPHNPRRDVGDVSDLAADIAENGVDQALTLVPDPDHEGDYRTVIGHRRHAACELAGRTHAPAIIRDDLTPAQQRQMMVRENIHRADLTAVEEADAYQAMLDIDGLTVEQIATSVSRSETTVRSRLRIAALPETARHAVHTHTATLEDAAALAEFEDADPVVRQALADQLGTSGFRIALASAVRLQHVRAVITPFLERLRAAKLVELDGSEWSTPEGSEFVAHATPDTLQQVPDERRSGYNVSGAAFSALIDQATAGWSYRERYNDLYLFRPLDLVEAQSKTEADSQAADRAAREQEERTAAAAAHRQFVEASAQTRRQFLEHLIHDRKLTKAESDAITGYAGTALILASVDDDHEHVLVWWEPLESAPASWLRVDLTDVMAHVADSDHHEIERTTLLAAAVRLAPANRLLAVLAAAVEPLRWAVSSTDGALAERWYALLEQLGYTVSDAERAALTSPTDDAEDD